MPIDLGVNAPNIAHGWGPPPQLHAPEIGSLVRAILEDRLRREKQTGESIADTIKNVREERQGNAYTDQLRAAGLLPEGEVGGPFGAKYAGDIARLIQAQQRTDLEREQQGYMEPYYRALTERAGRPDARGARGAPRYSYTIPGTDETVDLPGEAYARRRAEDVTTGSYQGLLKSEADAQAEIQRLETKWGGAPKGRLKGAPAWPWQEDTTKGERTQDQILYNRARQQYEMNRTQRENLEKRKPGIVGGAPAPVDTDPGETVVDVEDTTKQPALSDADREAFEWAQANPTDPRAIAILKKLGIH